jgi:protein SCO1/2
MRAVTRSLIGAVALASAGMLAPTAAWALADNAPESHVHDHHMTSETMHSNAPESHAHEHHMMSGTKRSTVDYTLPAVMLVRDDGQTVALKNELDDGRPVVLTFIYTTCTTICPLISQTLSQLQSELGADRDKVHLVSISIDPEEDTPARLREYAKKFGAGPQWQHYTGTVAASIAAQRAFDVYRGDKMSHNPVTLFRAAPGKPWLRIDGFVTAAELLSAYHDLAASK